MSAYIPGKLVKKAAATKRIGLILPILNVFVGVLVALPISIPVEEARLSAFCEKPFLVASATALFFVLVRLLIGKWYVQRVNAHGSFLYISALHEQENDRDKFRLERVMERTAIAVKGASVPQFNLLKPVEIDLKKSSGPAEALGTLQNNLSFALKADDSDLPTQLLMNMLWPLAVQLGIRTDLKHEQATLWYLKDDGVKPSRWIKKYQWLDNTLLDTIDLPSLAAQFPNPLSAGISTPASKDTFDGNRSDIPVAAASVILELSGSPIPDNTSISAFNAAYNGASQEWRVRPANELKQGELTDPVHLAHDAVRAAATIFRAVKSVKEQQSSENSKTKKIPIFGRVAKPQAFAIGHMLRLWAPADQAPEEFYSDIEFYNWQQGKYDLWKFNQ